MQNLKDSELRYRRLFEAAQDGILILNAKTGMITDVNPFLIRLLGYSREEFVEKKLWEVGAFKDVKASKEAFGALQEDAYIRYEDLPLRAKDGRLVEVEFVSNVYLVGAEKVIQCNIRDITARKSAEAHLQLRAVEMEMLYENGLALSKLLEPHEIGQKLIDLIAQRMEWHHTAIRLLYSQPERLELLAFSQSGLEEKSQLSEVEGRFNRLISRPGEGLAGWAIQNAQIVRSGDLHHDPRYKETFAGMQSGLYVPLQTGQKMLGIISLESEAPDSFSETDERLLVTLANQAAVAIENAQFYQTAQQEITERKRIESLLANEKKQLEKRVEARTADLSRANSNLAHALRVKDEFLASMSHELRTPLTGILGLSEALQLKVYGELNDRQLKIIQVLETSGRHLLALINDILDLTKIEAGKIDLELTPCSMNEICQASLQLTKGMSQQKHQRVHYSPPLQPIILQADARRLKQILVNLLGNAIKFSPDGADLGLELQPDPLKQTLKVSVWDTGIGIKSEDLHKLFLPFVQIDSRLGRLYPGTGLGLSLALRLTELHQGGIEVESQFGLGSRFTVVLPWQALVPEPAAWAVGLEAAREAVPFSPETQPRRPAILIIDDNEPILEMLADFLEANRYRVRTTRSGLELLKQAADELPDLFLIDIQLPGMNGLEIIRRLRALPNPLAATVPVIAITALTMPGDRELCLEAGADVYLSKPVKLLELAASIQQLLALRQ